MFLVKCRDSNLQGVSGLLAWLLSALICASFRGLLWLFPFSFSLRWHPSPLQRTHKGPRFPGELGQWAALVEGGELTAKAFLSGSVPSSTSGCGSVPPAPLPHSELLSNSSPSQIYSGCWALRTLLFPCPSAPGREKACWSCWHLACLTFSCLTPQLFHHLCNQFPHRGPAMRKTHRGFSLEADKPSSLSSFIFLNNCFPGSYPSLHLLDSMLIHTSSYLFFRKF